MLGALLFGEMVTFKYGNFFSTFDLNKTDSARTLSLKSELENVKQKSEVIDNAQESMLTSL